MPRTLVYGLKYGIIWLKSHKIRTLFLTFIFILSSMFLTIAFSSGQLINENVKNASRQVSISALLSSSLQEHDVQKIIEHYENDDRVSKVKLTDKEETKRMLSDNDKNIYKLVPDDQISQSITIYAKNKKDMLNLEKSLKHDDDVLYTSNTDLQMTIYKTLNDIKTAFMKLSIIIVIMIFIATAILSFMNNTSMKDSIISMRLQGADIYYTYGPLVISNIMILVLGWIISFVLFFVFKYSILDQFLKVNGFKILSIQSSLLSSIMTLSLSILIVLLSTISTIFYSEYAMNGRNEKS